MVTLIFESHSTTIDNEKNLSSGHNDVELSRLGIQQAMELGRRYEKEALDVVFCSDLKRSYKTAEIAFARRNVPILKDKRLRECDYGDLTQHPSSEVDPEKIKHIDSPFPGGESYLNTTKRMKDFLGDLLQNYNYKKIMVIGHRATQYGLEHLIKGVPLEDAITMPWHWQPGWVYKLTNHSSP
jgi:broad specificity phosphatase PhoE